MVKGSQVLWPPQDVCLCAPCGKRALEFRALSPKNSSNLYNIIYFNIWLVHSHHHQQNIQDKLSYCMVKQVDTILYCIVKFCLMHFYITLLNSLIPYYINETGYNNKTSWGWAVPSSVQVMLANLAKVSYANLLSSLLPS